MIPADFRKRLLDAEVPANAGLLDQVLTARARKKRSRYLRLGAGITLALCIIGVLLVYIVDGASSFKATGKTGALSQNEPTTAAQQSGVKNYHNPVISPPAVVEPSQEQTGPVVQADAVGKHRNHHGSSFVFPTPEKTSNQRYPNEGGIFDASGWTIYPPLSALDKPMESLGTEIPASMESKWFGLLSFAYRKPEAMRADAVNSGKKQLNNTWLIDVLAEPAWMQLHSGNAAYSKLLNATEHQSAAMQAMLRVGKSFGNDFRWFAGLKWAEQWSRFQYQSRSYETKTIVDVVQVIIREPGLPDHQVTVYDTNTMNSIVQTNYQSANRSRMIGVPLGVQYAPGGKSASIYIFGSLLPAYVLNSRGMRVQPDGSVAFLESEGYLRRFQLSSEFGLGLRKTLAPGIFLAMEPRFSYGLLSLSKAPVRQQGFNMGMNIGLSFRPGR